MQWRSEAALSRPAPRRESDSLAAGATTTCATRSSPAACSPAPSSPRSRSPSSSASAAGPIREAIGRLAAEGLVTVRPRRGAVVRSLSKEEFLELYQVREALEMMAVRLAVPRLGDEDVAALEALIDDDGRARRARRGRGVLRGERGVPRRASSRRRATRSSASCTGSCSASWAATGLRSLTLRGNLQRSVAEHAAILRAAKRGDADRAAHLMSEHIRVPQRQPQGR